MLLLGVDILYIPLLCLSISAAVLGQIFLLFPLYYYYYYYYIYKFRVVLL